MTSLFIVFAVVMLFILLGWGCYQLWQKGIRLDLSPKILLTALCTFVVTAWGTFQGVKYLFAEVYKGWEYKIIAISVGLAFTILIVSWAKKKITGLNVSAFLISTIILSFLLFLPLMSPIDSIKKDVLSTNQFFSTILSFFSPAITSLLFSFSILSIAVKLNRKIE